MNTQFFSTLFITIIVVWSIWAALSSGVRDGIVGKVIYSIIALAGFAIIQRSEQFIVTPTVAGITFHGALACAAIRHFCMVTWWPSVKAWLCKKLNCEHCLSRDDRRMKTERRRS